VRILTDYTNWPIPTESIQLLATHSEGIEVRVGYMQGSKNISSLFLYRYDIWKLRQYLQVEHSYVQNLK